MLWRSLVLILWAVFPASFVRAEWSGSFGLKAFGYAHRMPAPAETPLGAAELVLEGRGALGDTGRWNFSPWVFAQGPADSDEKIQVEPTQAYLEKQGGALKTRLGFQTFAWEGTDLLNPFDMIHARNYRDPLSIRSRPSMAWWTSWESGPWQAEFIYIPAATKPLLPGDTSLWWPREKRLPMDSENLEVRLPKGVEYRMFERETLNRALSDNFAVRLIRRGEQGDVSIAVFEGLTNDPTVVLGPTDLNPLSFDPLIVEPEGPVGLRPLDIRHRALAGGFNWAFSTGVFRWAGRTQQPLGDDKRVPAWSNMNVASWEQNVMIRERECTLLFEVFWMQKSEEEKVSFLRSIFERTAAAGARLPLTDDHEIYAGGVYDSIGRSSLGRFVWKARWSDTLTTEAEANFLTGPPPTLLGVFNDYDRLDFAVRRSF